MKFHLNFFHRTVVWSFSIRKSNGYYFRSVKKQKKLTNFQIRYEPKYKVIILFNYRQEQKEATKKQNVQNPQKYPHFNLWLLLQ